MATYEIGTKADRLKATYAAGGVAAQGVKVIYDPAKVKNRQDVVRLLGEITKQIQRDGLKA